MLQSRWRGGWTLLRLKNFLEGLFVFGWLNIIFVFSDIVLFRILLFLGCNLTPKFFCFRTLNQFSAFGCTDNFPQRLLHGFLPDSLLPIIYADLKILNEAGCCLKLVITLKTFAYKVTDPTGEVKTPWKMCSGKIPSSPKLSLRNWRLSQVIFLIFCFTHWNDVGLN